MSEKTKQQKRAGITALIERPDIMGAIRAALSEQRAVTLETFVVALKQAAVASPEINLCVNDNPGSVIGVVLEAAQLGLRPGRIFKHFAIIPRKNKAGKWYADRQVEWRGYIELAERSGRLEHCEARPIFKGERFVYDPGTGELDVPKDTLGDDEIERTAENIIGAYAVARITGRKQPIVVMVTPKMIQEARESSDSWKAWKAGKSKRPPPWETHTIQQVKKTAYRRLFESGLIPLGESNLRVAPQEDAADDADEEIVRQAEYVVSDRPPDDREPELAPSGEPWFDMDEVTENLGKDDLEKETEPGKPCKHCDGIGCEVCTPKAEAAGDA